MSAINFRNLCLDILSLDDAIRFAGVATFEGDIVASEVRKDATAVSSDDEDDDNNTSLLLSVEEAQLLMIQSLIRMNMRKTLEPRLGKTVFALAEYQKIKRGTFVLYDPQTLEREAILAVSFDKTVDACLLIEQKIKPIIRKFGRSPEGE